ncbi:MAG: GNAT family N-acetyltransferase [Saprospiraceae bacterium]|nr:GNAT family N-acetyltransferase [Lewinella sp.]
MKIDFVIENKPEIVAELVKTVQAKHEALYPEVFRPYEYERLLTWYQKIQKKEHILTVMIKHADEYIGYVLITCEKGKKPGPFVKSEQGVLYIDQMSIREEYQNQGVGVQFFDFIKDYARENDFQLIELDVWADNVQARQFYKKIGFKVVREAMELKIEEQ